MHVIGVLLCVRLPGVCRVEVKAKIQGLEFDHLDKEVVVGDAGYVE